MGAIAMCITPAMTTAVCFGELLVDMVGQEADATLGEVHGFIKAPGGAPANVAAGLNRLNTPSRFVGQVGDDPFGDWLGGVLEREGVDVRYLRRSSSARTTLAFIATRSDGRKDICFYRNPGADAQLSVADLEFSMFEDARLFHCGGVSLSQSPCREAQFTAAREARNRNLLVSFDPNWRPSLWADHEAARDLMWQMMPLSDVVKIADEEWEYLTGTRDLAEGAAKIRDAGPRLVVVTLGADGAYFDCESAQGRIEPFPVKVVDTLGAGDAFVAGLLHQLLCRPSLDAALAEAPLREIVRFANACGALATQKAGAIPALPSHHEVSTFLQSGR